MSPLELAQRYLESFTGERPLDDMAFIVADDLTFNGPWAEFDTAQAYLEAMRANPVKGASCEILEAFENEHSACLIYRFSKPGVQTLMAQSFQTRDGKITRIRLIFDSKAFS